MDVQVKQGAFGSNYMMLSQMQNNQGRWDSWLIQGGTPLANSYQFYQVPLNQQGSGFARVKTYRETNLTQRGKLEAGVNGTVKAIYVTVSPTGQNALSSATADYIMTFLADSVLTIYVNNAEMAGPRACVYHAGYGLSGFTELAGGADEILVTRPPSNKVKMFQMIEAIGIPANTGFRVELIPNQNNAILQAGPPEGADLKTTVYLMGRFGSVAVN
jgi:hypothetical protein